MPSSETPTNLPESQEQNRETVDTPNVPAQSDLPTTDISSETGERVVASGNRGTSRWVDYDTHELLEMISELEDERRWSRLREGIWVAILVHALIISAVTWIPKYIFKVPQVIDPIDALQHRKDLAYLDMPEALRQLQPKIQPKPTPQQKPRIESKPIEQIQHALPPPQPQPIPEQQPQLPLPTPPPTPQPSETPHPSSVPARPNFAMGSSNPADALQNAMRGASRGSGSSSTGNVGGGGHLAMHPGAGGGVEVLSDMQGVDFNNWLHKWYYETSHTWDPLIPDEANPPISKAGQVLIRFKVLPNGRIMDGSMMLEGRSGDPALDRAAWGALTGSNYPPLPSDFHGPYLELRALFMYNMGPR